MVQYCSIAETVVKICTKSSPFLSVSNWLSRSRKISKSSKVQPTVNDPIIGLPNNFLKSHLIIHKNSRWSPIKKIVDNFTTLQPMATKTETLEKISWEHQKRLRRGRLKLGQAKPGSKLARPPNELKRGRA